MQSWTHSRHEGWTAEECDNWRREDHGDSDDEAEAKAKEVEIRWI